MLYGIPMGMRASALYHRQLRLARGFVEFFMRHSDGHKGIPGREHETQPETRLKEEVPLDAIALYYRNLRLTRAFAEIYITEFRS